MDIHNHALLTPRGRATMVAYVCDYGWSRRATAWAFRTTTRTVSRWVARFEADGHTGLHDRRSRPRRQPSCTPRRLQRQVRALRRQRWTLQRIAAFVGVSRATVGRILVRAGFNRLSELEAQEPPQRYEHEAPGDLLHLDIKKLSRFHQPGHRVTGVRTKDSQGAGWEFVHVAIDDRSRIAFAEIHPDEGRTSAIAHLQAAVAYYARLGVTVRRILTDNGPCYRSRAFERACRELGPKHRFTRPYRSRTNGKAERFIQTALREWAYAFSYRDADERAAHLPRWLHDYNWHRQRGSLGHRPPTTDHRPPTTDHRPPTTDHRSPITDHRSPITGHRSVFSAYPGTTW